MIGSLSYLLFSLATLGVSLTGAFFHRYVVAKVAFGGFVLVSAMRACVLIEERATLEDVAVGILLLAAFMPFARKTWAEVLAALDGR